MIIIIDGYNLLKQIFPGVRGKLDQHKAVLIKQLALYKHKKQGAIKDIVLVFDGGDFGHASREVKGGVVIMHAGHKSSADEWIIAFAEKNTGKELLLVTLDRELIAQCHNYHVVALAVNDFYSMMQSFIMQENQGRVSDNQSTDVLKYEADDTVAGVKGCSSEVLDILMEGASLRMPVKKEDNYGERKRRGAENKASKTMRKINNIVKKLT